MPLITLSGSDILAAMLSGRYWAGGADLVLTYSTPRVGSVWPGYPNAGLGGEPFLEGYSVFTSGQAQTFAAVMELMDSFVGASFTLVDDQIDLGAIRIAFTSVGPDLWGYAYHPDVDGNPNLDDERGDIWISSSVAGSAFNSGSFDFLGLMHEIGHALGLQHSFEGDHPLPEPFDNYRYTIMSYSSQIDHFVARYTLKPFGMSISYNPVYPITPMPMDIYALQNLYGADPATRAEDTNYTFDPDLGVIKTIYDAGGIDTWSLTGHLRPSFVDLRPGAFSSVDYYSREAQIEANVAAVGETHRSDISQTFSGSSIFTWSDNVAIAFGTIIENVDLGDADDSATGNDVANIIRGFAGSDRLDGGDGDDTLDGGGGSDTLIGGLGADTMTGGDGDDTYVVDHAGDITSETSALGGADTVQSSVTRTLGANLENLTLTGVAAINGFGNILYNTITGNGSANQLNGFDGNDILDGGAGADAMFGGNGDDTYYVDHAGDVTSEVSALGGTDAVISSVSRNLTAHIENLTLTGSADLTAAGNTLNNALIGNSGANILYGFEGNDRLNGGLGADTMFGGASGDDYYIVDDVGDITVEGVAGPAGGIDTVETWISRNLNANFENMILMGSASIAYGNVLDNTLTGNALANSLYGFDGNDTLDGGAGADQMFGANGDDTYIVDNAGDVTSETSALGGADTVMSSVERNLTANLENLALTGSASINGAGNGLNNVITGNSGANTLYGLDGNDRLDGGLGADTLQGGANADTYAFTTALGGGNVDAIIGFNVADDTIYLNNAVFTGLSTGALAADAFVIGSAAADADDRIVYDSATGQLFFDADGNGAEVAVLFATLSAGLALTGADFIVGGG